MSRARISCQKTLGLQHQEDYTTKESNQHTLHQCKHGNPSRHVQCKWKQWTVSNTCKWNRCSLSRARAWWIKLLLAARADIKLFWMPDYAGSNLFKECRSSHEDEPCALNAPRYLWSSKIGLEVSRIGFRADNIRLRFSVILVLLSNRQTNAIPIRLLTKCTLQLYSFTRILPQLSRVNESKLASSWCR